MITAMFNRSQIFERRDDVRKYAESISKVAECVLDRSISKRPRMHSKSDRMPSRPSHFRTLSIAFGTFSFPEKQTLIRLQAFSFRRNLSLERPTVSKIFHSI